MKVSFPYSLKTSRVFGIIPTIKIRLSLKVDNEFESFTFLFDTGAEVTSMPLSAAKKLGIDLKKCPQIKMSGFEGTTVTVYRSKITVLFNKKVFVIPCVFHPNEEIPLLLGCAGILSRFIITLDAKKKVATFQEI